jgi:hypothetical protein
VIPIVVVAVAVVALIATLAPPRTTIARARVGRTERITARVGSFAAGLLRRVEHARDVAIGAGFLGAVAVGLVTMYLSDEAAIVPAAAYVLLGAVLFVGRSRPHSAS